MNDERWYIKVTLPSGDSYCVYEDGPFTNAHMEFQFAEAYPAHVIEFKYRRVIETVPFGTVVRIVDCDADEFALPENLRRVINA
nr:MAG TPA: hypothetical protein [Caudoviricetes sp.]